MPITSDTILDWIHEDGYSLSEAGWIRARDRYFYFEVTATASDTSHEHRIERRL